MSDSGNKLLSKFESLKTQFFGVYISEIEKNRRYYDRDFRSEVVPSDDADDLFILIPPTARRSIDEAVDHILYTPHVKVPVRPGESVVEQEIAERKRKFLAGFWHQVENSTNPLGDGRKTLINEGRICIRHTMKWELIPDKPESSDRKGRRKYRRDIEKLGSYEFLWNVELLDNVTVFEDPSDHRDPGYVYVSYPVLVEHAKRLFPNASGVWKEHADLDEVRYLEYWSKPTITAAGIEPGEFYQWIESDEVHHSENPYRYVPIAIEDAGYGHNRPRAKAHEKYVGMSQHMQDVFVAQARQWTTLQAVTEISGFPPTFTRNMDPGRTIRVGPRTVIPLAGAKGEPQSEDVEFPTWPQTNDSVLHMIARIEYEANAALKMNTIGGEAQRGVDTATEADQQIRNASAKLSGPLAAMKRLVTKINKWALMDIEDLEAPVTVYGANLDDEGEITLTPTDIGGFYETRVEMRTTDDDAVAQVKARFWAEMYRVIPFLSAFTAMERGDIADDPTLEMTRRAGEDVFLSEEFRAMRVLSAAMAAQRQQELAMAQSQVQEPGAGAASAPAGGIESPLSAEPGGSPFDEAMENPSQAALFGNALAKRDITQGASQIRG